MGFYVPEVAPEEEGGTAAIGGGGLGAFVTSELQVRAYILFSAATYVMKCFNLYMHEYW